MKKKLPKYEDGGFWDKSGQVGMNYLRALGDIPLSAVGLNNVISDNEYKGAGSKFMRGYGNIVGGVANAALPAALQTVGVPAPVTRIAQGAIGQFNPEGESGSDQIAGIANMGMKLAPMLMPYGGQPNMSNAELEKQENTLNPDGSTTQFNGPSHAQGGIPTQLDPNTLVFSDRLKMGKKTFADLNKPNMTKKEDKILNDSKSTAVSKITAQLMKDVKNRKSVELFNQQEQLKADKVAKYADRVGYKMPNGGNVSMYPYGGSHGNPTGDPLNFDPAYANAMTAAGYMPIDSDAISDNFRNQIANRTPRLLDMPENDPSEAFKAQIANRVPRTLPSTEDTTPMNYDNILKQAALGVGQNVGNLYDLYRSRPNAIETRQYDRFNANLLDPTQSIRDNNMIFRNAATGVKEGSVGNSAVYLNNRRALAAKKMEANSRIRANYDNQNSEIKNRIGMYNNELGNREKDVNAMIQANARNIRSNALSNIGQNIMGQVGSNNKMTRDKQYLDILSQEYPEILRDPRMAELFKNLK